MGELGRAGNQLDTHLPEVDLAVMIHFGGRRDGELGRAGHQLVTHLPEVDLAVMIHYHGRRDGRVGESWEPAGYSPP